MWLRSFVRATLLEQHSQSLETTAEHINAELDTALLLRLQTVSVAAAMLSRDVQRGDGERLRNVLETVRQGMPDLIWLAVTDADGFIVTATEPQLVGQNVNQYTWRSQGLDAAWIEEGRSPSERFLKLTAPLRNADGAIIGVVAANLSWTWVQAMVAQIRAPQGEWLLIDRDGVVRHGPAALLGRRWRDLGEAVTPFDPAIAGLGTDGSDLPARIRTRRLVDNRPYLIATPPNARDGTLRRLGWQGVVIQPVQSVAAFATAIGWQITIVLTVLGLAAALAGIVVALHLTRGIRTIARSADAVLAGSATRIVVPPGVDEAARLGSALDRLLGALQRERDELRRLNIELDERVRQRAEEIERLARESRDAEVVRERLRLARGLHDTLAHSMMAMLTEIRVLKLLATSRPDALPEELRRAEQAARDGLDEARRAIDQLRSNPVRDIGLGAALADLARGLGERTGITVDCRIDPAMGALSAEPAQTVFHMCEEVLRNVERHAAARNVVVRLQRVAGDTVELEIADDGVGFEARAHAVGHYGLVGLAEQAEAIGARLDIASRPGEGTRVSLRWTQAGRSEDVIAARPAIHGSRVKPGMTAISHERHRAQDDDQ
jgi:signal transduction histidine kinase